MDNYEEIDKRQFDYQDLDNLHTESNLVCNGRPDIYQFHQNQLCQKIAEFILKPYWEFKKKLNDE